MNARQFPRITAEELEAVIGPVAAPHPTSSASIVDYLERAVASDAGLSDLDALLIEADDGAATAAQMAELAAWTRFLQQEADALADMVARPDEWASVNPMH